MRISILILGMLICTAGFSKDLSVKRKLADNYYNHFDFYKAIPLYDELLKSHPSDSSVVYERLALIYDHLNDSENAERCYSVLVQTNEVKPDYLLNFARALSRNGKYDQAIYWWGKYREARPDDSRGAAFSGAYRNMNVLYRDSSFFRIKKEPFSGGAGDFSPAYFGGSIVFSSDRPDFSMVRSTYNWTRTPFLDLYAAEKDSTVAKPFSRELNSRYHEGPVTFSKNQDTIIFTRSNYTGSRLRMSSEGINRLNLFRASWDTVQKKWTGITPLGMNSDEYSVEHPALSADGRRLYFASDMPGGEGGFDLYVSVWNSGQDGSKTWSTPKNLGPVINTRGNELFPFIDKMENLWFASNGIPGLGGLDIFRAEKQKEGFSVPVNQGYPLNTRFDDFGLITSGAGEEGYFSSDRNNRFGNDDIYSFSKYYRKPVVAYDTRTGEILPTSGINVSEQGAAPLMIANETALVAAFSFKPFSSYDLSCHKEGFKEGKIALTKEQIQMMDTIRIPMVKEGPVLNLSGFVFAAGDRTPMPGYSAMITTGSGAAIKEIKSDLQGLFRGQLLSGTDYRVVVTGPDGKSKCITSPVEFTTRGIVKDSTISALFPVYCEGDLIAMEDIYYDLDRYNIRPDAANVLDKLLRLMNDYPKMKIELRSHTDSRASTGYNMSLSDKRAKSAAEYLFSKGIARDRIKGKGYGETMPVNKCTDGVPCSEEEHQKNRRTEFKILSLF